MCTLAPAKAHEVQIGVENGLGVQSNVLRSLTSPKRDGTYVLTPTITFFQSDSDFTYDLEYRPRYTNYFETEGIDGVDHLIRGRGSYRFNARDTVRLTADFSRTRTIRTAGLLDITGQPLVVANDNGTSQRFMVNAALDHGFSATTVGTVSLEYGRWDYTNLGNIDNQSLGGELQVTHAPFERLVLGLNGTAQYRAFAESPSSPASFSTTLNVNAVLDYDLTPSIQFRATGGPASVLTRQSEPSPQVVSRFDPIEFDPVVCTVGPCGRIWGLTAAPAAPVCAQVLGQPLLGACPVLGPVVGVPGFLTDTTVVSVDPGQSVLFGQKRETFTYFVSLSLTRRFSRGSASASFVRNEDAGSGQGATTILNSVSGRFTYSLNDRWRLGAVGVYTFRESASVLLGSTISARNSGFETSAGSGLLLAESNSIVATQRVSNFKLQVGVVDVDLTRQLGEHSSLQFRFQYYNQSQENPLGPESAFDNFTGSVSYVYEFDPYKL